MCRVPRAEFPGLPNNPRQFAGFARPFSRGFPAHHDGKEFELEQGIFRPGTGIYQRVVPEHKPR
jgi:hypothetical protein